MHLAAALAAPAQSVLLLFSHFASSMAASARLGEEDNASRPLENLSPMRRMLHPRWCRLQPSCRLKCQPCRQSAPQGPDVEQHTFAPLNVLPTWASRALQLAPLRLRRAMSLATAPRRHSRCCNDAVSCRRWESSIKVREVLAK